MGGVTDALWAAGDESSSNRFEPAAHGVARTARTPGHHPPKDTNGPASSASHHPARHKPPAYHAKQAAGISKRRPQGEAVQMKRPPPLKEGASVSMRAIVTVQVAVSSAITQTKDVKSSVAVTVARDIPIVRNCSQNQLNSSVAVNRSKRTQIIRNTSHSSRKNTVCVLSLTCPIRESTFQFQYDPMASLRSRLNQQSPENVFQICSASMVVQRKMVCFFDLFHVSLRPWFFGAPALFPQQSDVFRYLPRKP